MITLWLTIIGIGLIGSSLARVIMKKGLAGKLCAYDKNPEYLAEAGELGIVDEISDDLGESERGTGGFGSTGK